MLLFLLALYLLVLSPQALTARGIASSLIAYDEKGVSSSFLASTSLKDEGQLDLLYGLDAARGRGGRGGLYDDAVSSMECLKHQGNLALISSRLVHAPEERPTTAAPYRPQDV